MGYRSRTLVAAENKYHSSKLIENIENIGIENIVADSLSRYPLLQERNLERYSQHLNLDEVKSAFDAVVNQVGNNET